MDTKAPGIMLQVLQARQRLVQWSTKLSDLHGLTVAGVVLTEDRLYLGFTDGTYAMFKAEAGEGGCEMDRDRQVVRPSDLSPAQWDSLGVLTAEEARAAIGQQHAEEERLRERAERQQLARLKAKYEGGEQ